MPYQPDGRRHRRVTLKIPATVLVGSEQSMINGHLMDLSEGGAFIMLDAGFDARRYVHLSFSVDPDVFCETTGRIIRLMPLPSGQLGIGIEFGKSNPPFVHFIRNLAAAASEFESSNFLADIREVKIKIL